MSLQIGCSSDRKWILRSLLSIEKKSNATHEIVKNRHFTTHAPETEIILLWKANFLLLPVCWQRWTTFTDLEQKHYARSKNRWLFANTVDSNRIVAKSRTTGELLLTTVSRRFSLLQRLQCKLASSKSKSHGDESAGDRNDMTAVAASSSSSSSRLTVNSV